MALKNDFSQRFKMRLSHANRMEGRQKEGRKEARKEIQTEGSGGDRTIHAALFFLLGFNEAAYNFKERYLQEN